MRENWLNFTLQRSWLALLMSMAFVIIAAVGGKNLFFRGDYKVFFAKDNVQLVDYEQMQRVFNKNENVSIVVAPRSNSVFNQTTLTLIKELTEAAWQTPYSSRVDSIANFQFTWSEDDDLVVEDLVLDASDITPERVSKVRDVALSEPALVDKLVGRSGEATVVNITVQLPDGDTTKEVVEITDFVVRMTDEFKVKYPEHDFYHTGVVLMNHSFATEAQKDAETLIPLMFLAIVLVMCGLLRSLVGTLATVSIIFCTIVATMGLGGWLGFFLSLTTVNVPIMVMTLAVADCIHVISSMLFALKRGKNKTEALRYSMQINLKPIFITSITTAIGFLTLNFAEVPVLADLGNLAALGVMLACLLSLTLLPALLMLLPMREERQAKSSSDGSESYANWVILHHKKLFPITLIGILLMSAFTLNNRMNDVATEYFDQSTAFRQSVDFQEKAISGMTTIDFAIYAERESAINEPEVLKLIGDFSDWMLQQPEVQHVASIADTFKRLNKNMHSDNPEYYRLPDNQELAAQYLLLYEMSLPYGLDLNNQLDINKSATRIQVTMLNLGSRELTDLEGRAKAWFVERAPDLRVAAASPSLMFAHIGEANMTSMMKGSIVALILISMLLIFALRSWRMGLISLLPNLMPAGIGFGIWGLYSSNINLGLSVVLSMTLGIIVDDTVHFLSKYQHAREAGKSARNAVAFAFASVGRALWITTLVLAVGFAMLTFSAFSVNSEMGLLTSIIIVAALAVDFTFLPAFLILFDKKKYTSENRDDGPATQM